VQMELWAGGALVGDISAQTSRRWAASFHPVVAGGSKVFGCSTAGERLDLLRRYCWF
jgi:hypothetical protein